MQPELETPPLAIFVSPHFDDIALSCGGIAARLARIGARCIGLTIFAAPPPEGVELSPYAAGMHAEWERSNGASVKTINEIRREEERAAMHLMGLEPVWLDLCDAPYRQSSDGRYLYTSDEQLFGKIAPEERKTLVPQIAGLISGIVRQTGATGRVRVFAPLGVGRHVDHQIAFNAARRLGPRCGVLFYEDFPYTLRQGALEARLTGLNMPAQPRITPIGDLIGVKIAAIARYKSQNDVLFGTAEAMPGAVRAFAEAVGGAEHGGQYAERVWHIPSSYTLG
jgi:LmbE family N-acetylglucosaminyl deacetylase